MGAGEREVLVHRHLGVGLADEAFSPRDVIGAAAVLASARAEGETGWYHS